MSDANLFRPLTRTYGCCVISFCEFLALATSQQYPFFCLDLFHTSIHSVSGGSESLGTVSTHPPLRAFGESDSFVTDEDEDEDFLVEDEDVTLLVGNNLLTFMWRP